MMFEDGRDLHTTEELENEDPKWSIRDLDLVYLFPAAVEWTKGAGCNIVQLSEVLWNDCPSTVGQAGPLFIQLKLGR